MILYPNKAVLLTAPATFPVTLTEAKAQLNFSTSVDDTVFQRFIHAVTDQGEKWTGRRFVTQTHDVYAQGWPADGVWELPFGWLQSVTEIYYTDTDGAETLLAASVYDVNAIDSLGSVSLGYNQSWPTVTLRPTNPIRIRFICGRYYGEEWVTETVYAAGAVVIPTTANYTGFAYQTLGGTADVNEPTWPRTIAGTVADGTVTWVCVGKVVDPVVRNALLIAIAGYYEERNDIVITQGGILLDLTRIKKNLGFIKIFYTGAD